MKRNYRHPQLEIMPIQAESPLCAGTREEYEIGGNSSKWPESGPIQEGGPGVAGAKKGFFDDSSNESLD